MHKKKIYLVRHGETDNNLQKILQGGRVDIRLNETGRQQAKAFHQKYKVVPFKKIYTSTLQRSIESVEPFLQDGIPYAALPELNEISYGIYDGKISSEGNNPYSKLIQDWERGNLTFKMEGGESPIEVQDRLKKFISNTLKKDNESPILLCMHGRAIRIFLATILHYDLSYMHVFKHSNLGLYLLDYSEKLFFIEKFNDTSHLKNSSQKLIQEA